MSNKGTTSAHAMRVGRLVDGTGAEPVQGAVVQIGGGKITWVGPF